MDRRGDDMPELSRVEETQRVERGESQRARDGTVPGARQFNQVLKRAGTPRLANANSDQWRYVFTLIWSEYAYCTMFGVNVLDGNIVSCDNIQRSLTFGPSAAGSAEVPKFDEFWEALQTLCGGIRTGRLAELRFNRGKPVSAKTSEGGRRFRRLVRKSDEQL